MFSLHHFVLLIQWNIFIFSVIPLLPKRPLSVRAVPVLRVHTSTVRTIQPDSLQGQEAVEENVQYAVSVDDIIQPAQVDHSTNVTPHPFGDTNVPEESDSNNNIADDPADAR